MMIDKQTQSKRLFRYLSDISPEWVEEAETADLVSELRVSRRRKYRKFAAVSLGMAVVYWLFKTKRLDLRVLKGSV